MPHDAIEGARYRDDVFDDEFVLTDVEPESFDSHDDEEIELTLEYDEVGTVTVDLAQFRRDASIEVIEVPEE